MYIYIYCVCLFICLFNLESVHLTAILDNEIIIARKIKNKKRIGNSGSGTTTHTISDVHCNTTIITYKIPNAFGY